MMSRAYWTGLMPRSLSRVRSQPSRLMPNRWATWSISWSMSAAVTVSFRRARACSIRVRLIKSLEDLLPLAGNALVGELLAGDDLIVDDRDRVRRIDRNPRRLNGRDIDLTQVLRRFRRAVLLSGFGGAGDRTRPGETLAGTLLGGA